MCSALSSLEDEQRNSLTQKINPQTYWDFVVRPLAMIAWVALTTWKNSQTFHLLGSEAESHTIFVCVFLGGKFYILEPSLCLVKLKLTRESSQWYIYDMASGDIGPGHHLKGGTGPRLTHILYYWWCVSAPQSALPDRRELPGASIFILAAAGHPQVQNVVFLFFF